MGVLPRRQRLLTVLRLLRRYPVVSLLGPRQCGKTTLARQVARQRHCEYFDLESPADLARLSTPFQVLDRLRGLVVLDEIQRKPELFEYLRVLVDRPANQAQFLILGSASPNLVRGVSESLAGRVATVELAGFDLEESGAGEFRELWLRGGLPLSYLAPSDASSIQWRDLFIQTILERDIGLLGYSIPAAALRRFWTMLAHYHGQVWNAAEFARSLGHSEGTARRHLDLLCGAFLARALSPWHVNLAKRQVKAPKVYLRDSGLLHSLLSIENLAGLEGHPKVGASWEGFALEQVLALLQPREAWFWATHAGAELDLLVFLKGRPIGFEFKYMDAPRTTRSMQVALQDLNLERLFVVYPGKQSYALDKKIEVLAVTDLVHKLRHWKLSR